MNNILKTIRDVMAALLVTATLLLAVASDMAAAEPITSIKGFEFGMSGEEFIKSARAAFGDKVKINKYKPKSSESQYLGHRMTAYVKNSKFTVLGETVRSITLYTYGAVEFGMYSSSADTVTDFFGIPDHINTKSYVGAWAVESTYRQSDNNVVVVGEMEYRSYIRLTKRSRAKSRDI